MLLSTFLALNHQLPPTASTAVWRVVVEPRLIKYIMGICLIWLRDMDSKKIGVELFGEFWNMVQEENGEDKMVTESN